MIFFTFFLFLSPLPLPDTTDTPLTSSTLNLAFTVNPTI